VKLNLTGRKTLIKKSVLIQLKKLLRNKPRSKLFKTRRTMIRRKLLKKMVSLLRTSPRNRRNKIK